MKKLAGVLLTLLIAVSLTGCVKGKIHLTINKNKTADMEISLGMEKSLYSMLGTTDPFSELKASLKKEGYQVSDYSEDNYQGITGRNHYTDLAKSLNDLNISDQVFLSSGDSVKVDKGIFFDKYTVNANLDMSSIASDADASEEEKKLQDMFIKNMSFDFIITMPMKAVASNAAVVSQDKRTYTWKLVPGKNNNISLTMKVPDTARIISAIAAVLLIIVISAVIVKRKNKRKRKC